MATGYWEIIPFVRVFAGDLAAEKYTDDTIRLVLAVTTGALAILGYDKSYTSDPDGVSANLTEKEKTLWGKAAATFLQDPDALKAALEAVSVRTLGTSYSTEARARFMEAASGRAFGQLKLMILAMSSPLVGTADDLDKDTLP